MPKRLFEKSAEPRYGLRRAVAGTALLGASVAGLDAMGVTGHDAATTTPDMLDSVSTAEPSPDTTVSPPDDPLTLVAKPGDTLGKYAYQIEAQPGNRDMTGEAIKEDLVSLNGGAAIQYGQEVILPGYTHDMQPERPSTQLTPTESTQPK